MDLDDLEAYLGGFIIVIIFVLGGVCGAATYASFKVSNKALIEHGCAEYDKQTGEFKLIDRSEK